MKGKGEPASREEITATGGTQNPVSGCSNQQLSERKDDAVVTVLDGKPS